MKRLLLIGTLFAATTVPLALAADTPTDGTLSVKRGKGRVVLKVKGTVIGHVSRNARVQIRDFRPLDANDPEFTHCPHIRRIGAGTWLCTGRNIGYRVADGRFNVSARGIGVSISAVGRGSVTIDGNGGADGVYSVDAGLYESLPDDPTTLFLGTPPARR